jgi:hypothetical protein
MYEHFSMMKTLILDGKSSTLCYIKHGEKVASITDCDYRERTDLAEKILKLVLISEVPVTHPKFIIRFMNCFRQYSVK